MEFTRAVQIGSFKNDEGMTLPVLRALAEGESTEPQMPNSTLPDEWVDAFLRDMPNASILYRDRLRKWFVGCLDAGRDDGYNDTYDID
jgi:hypothetical protein